MNRYFIIILSLSCTWLICSHLSAQSQIGTYPPQIHQQICQESAYTRYLDVFNLGKDTLVWNAFFTPGPYDWVTASPLNGEVGPGDTMQIAFYFNSDGLAIDNYYAYLQINSNDPLHADTTVLAMLHVQQLQIIIEPESDSICYGCNTTLQTYVFGCSEEYTFSWESDPPGFYSTEKNPVVAPAVNTKYIFTVTDGGGTARDSVYIRVYGSSGIDELKEFPVLIYPNPTHGKFSVLINSESDGAVNFKIFDFSGRQVYFKEVELQYGTHEYVIGKDDLAPGIYFVSFKSMNFSGNNKSTIIKMIIN